MIKKIRYRLVFNRARRLNKRGEGLVQIEMEQGGRRLYLSTHTYVSPQYWQDGAVADAHPLAALTNAQLMRQRIDCERVELEYISRGVSPTIGMVRDAIREKMAPGAKVYDFIRGMTGSGSKARRDSTIAGYITLANSLERWHRGLYLADIDTATIGRYENAMKQKGLAHNTIVGRLRQLRAVMNEAVRRKAVDANPFRQLPHWPHGAAARLSHRRTARPARGHAVGGQGGTRARRLPLLLLYRPALFRLPHAHHRPHTRRVDSEKDG